MPAPTAPNPPNPPSPPADAKPPMIPRSRGFVILLLGLLLVNLVVSFATILGIAYLLQRQRNKLRGAGAEHRTGGYR